MNPLELLRNILNKSFDAISLSSSSWGQPQLMTKTLAEVKKTFGSLKSELKERSITEVLQRYRSTKSFQSFLDLKYTCFGIGQELKDGWCLFYDASLFLELLEQVEQVKAISELRRFRKCYQGLLYSYFSFEIFNCRSTENWERLRDYLSISLPDVMQANHGVDWLVLIDEHRNLLGQKPCERYAKELQDGDTNELYSALQDGLGVPRESWVWQELILSQIELACSSDDEHYKEDLDRLLKMIQDNSTLSTNLVISCIAMLVIRYAQCSSRPEHPSLRDAAIKYIGNPWLKRTAWDAHVKDKDGHPHEDARDMINGWIKGELIKNFFELLSEDGSADQRRLKYWLRFKPVIEDMWFALGPHAYNRHSHNFKYFEDFRNRAEGRLIKLEAPGLPQNNAFIMKIGPVTVVEFGLKGNATYMYHSETLPFDLSKLWIRGDSRGLKNQQAGTRFDHRDSKGTGIRWEAKLDKKLCPLIDFWPKPEKILRQEVLSKTQSSTPMTSTIAIETKSIQSWEIEIRKIVPNKLIEDNRSKGGAFWVRIKREPLSKLIDLGFKYKPEKGWWKE